ncbi:polysaccharide deacetylase family protein, partial [Streptomyces pseudovenezuelae]
MRARPLVAAGLAAVLLTGCAQSVDPIERLGKKAAQRVGSYGPARADGRPYRHWGLPAPLPAPPRVPARARADPLKDVTVSSSYAVVKDVDSHRPKDQAGGRA